MVTSPRQDVKIYESSRMVDKSNVGCFFMMLVSECQLASRRHNLHAKLGDLPNRRAISLAALWENVLSVWRIPLKWGWLSPFCRDGSFSGHASPSLPVRDFWQFLHFLILFYSIYFILIFLVITSPKVNVIALLEFEIAYYYIAGQHISFYVTETIPPTRDVWVWESTDIALVTQNNVLIITVSV